MKRALSFLLKFPITIGIGIFVGIFFEFGGGYAPVSPADLRREGALTAANPAHPGIVDATRPTLRAITREDLDRVTGR